MTEEDAKSLYRRAIRKIPFFECKQLCQESCGLVVWTEAEEIVIAAWMEKKGMEKRVGVMKGPNAGVCPYLEEGLCSIHEIRPIICRLYGIVKDDEKMVCPHGCRPLKGLKGPQVGRILKPLVQGGSTSLYGPFDLEKIANDMEAEA